MRVVLAVLVLAAALAASSARAAGLQHVTIIGDSVAEGMVVDPVAVATLKIGIDADLEIEACRRTDGTSCPHSDGTRPPTVVQLAKQMGSRLGDSVVVSVGYNDPEDQYADNVEAALAAFKAAGVRHVYWLTLRAARHPYVNMNADLAAAAKAHPELTLLDWNLYSRSHPGWFEDDGLHLYGEGGRRMAQFIHDRLVALGVASKPPRVLTGSLPLAHRGKRYAARLVAAGGYGGAYRWSLLARAPKGLSLAADGRVTGAPLVRPGRYTFDVRVTDAAGSYATRMLTLRVT